MSVLIIGVGNELRGDDGAGPRVAAALSALGYHADAHEGDGAELIEMWQGEDAVYLVDASSSGSAPGTRRRIDASETPLQSDFFRYSSHMFGLAEAIETARALGRLPKRVVVFAIEGADFATGAVMTAEVTASCDVVAADIARELGPPSAEGGAGG